MVNRFLQRGKSLKASRVPDKPRHSGPSKNSNSERGTESLPRWRLFPAKSHLDSLREEALKLRG